MEYPVQHANTATRKIPCFGIDALAREGMARQSNQSLLTPKRRDAEDVLLHNHRRLGGSDVREEERGNVWCEHRESDGVDEEKGCGRLRHQVESVQA